MLQYPRARPSSSPMDPRTAIRRCSRIRTRSIPLRENVKEHLAFGHGIHVCVGAGLARIEASSALRALGENVTALEVLDPSALRFGPSFGLRGLTELPVRVHRRNS